MYGKERRPMTERATLVTQIGNNTRRSRWLSAATPFGEVEQGQLYNDVLELVESSIEDSLL